MFVTLTVVQTIKVISIQRPTAQKAGQGAAAGEERGMQEGQDARQELLELRDKLESVLEVVNRLMDVTED